MAVILSREESNKVKGVNRLVQKASEDTGKDFSVSMIFNGQYQLDVDGNAVCTGTTEHIRTAVKLVYRAVTGCEMPEE